MKSFCCRIIFLACIIWGSLTVPSISQDHSILIKDVNIIPMTSDTVFYDKFVLIEEGVITKISNTDIEVTEEDTVIEGNGNFLLPGLADMHVHIFEEDELILYLANSITTIRNMWGWDLHLDLQQKIKAGEVIGPNIYTSGAIIDGDPPRLRGSSVVTTVKEAKQEVISQMQTGFDFLKVYDGIKSKPYFALLQFAEKYGTQVSGHVPDAVGLYGAIQGGQKTIEHLECYPNAIMESDSTIKNQWAGAINHELLNDAVDATVDNNVWNIPTIVVKDRGEMSAEDSRDFLEKTELNYVPETYKRFCCRTPYDDEDDLIQAEIEKRRSNRLTVLGKLHRNNANLLVGTDTGNQFVLPGYSIHYELENFLNAGIPVFETLKYATVEAARFLGKLAVSGTIETGKSTDMVLVEHNPLEKEHLNTLRNPLGIIVNGKWMSKSDIDQKLKAIAKENKE